MPLVEFIAGCISGLICSRSSGAGGRSSNGHSEGPSADSGYIQRHFRLCDQNVRSRRVTGVSNAVVFGSYSNALDYLTQSQQSERNHGNPACLSAVFAAGCFSGLMQVAVTAPVDLVKVRLQSQTGWPRIGGERYRGPAHCVNLILSEEGPRGMFRGGLALTLRDMPCYGLHFLPYEVTCRFLTEEGQQPGQLGRSVLGCIVQWIAYDSYAFYMDIFVHSNRSK
ncbi:hypothetical protein DPEC_G00238850 [Dallia pectoralis]|uniref:Uncharacterized protein n=1 Tax=Dallia pectoralis TaxID=75939 RepID=A0ACC2FZ08_DALPE|nr:hypothetical protein DPEC_G00238850 [Dallia pectoralis]